MKINFKKLIKCFVVLCMMFTMIPTSTKHVHAEEIINGWYTDEQGYTYYYQDGELIKDNSLSIEDKIYRFDEEGHVLTGWHYFNGYRVYSYSDGAVATGKVVIDEQTYIFNEVGEPVSYSVIYIDGYLYETDYDGCVLQSVSAVNGWNTLNGMEYYVFDGRVARDEFIQIENNTYYIGYYYEVIKDYMFYEIYDEENEVYKYYGFDSQGHMITGWYDSYGTKYYYYENGLGARGKKNVIFL